MSQGSDQQEDRKKALEKVHQLEEEERKRRMEEEKTNTHEKLVSMYKFQEELRSRTKGKDAV